MEIGEFQGHLGAAIAELDHLKSVLLDVFAWGGQMGMIRTDDRSHHLMNIEMVRISLPCLDIRLRKALELLSGNDPRHYLTFAALPDPPPVEKTGTTPKDNS